MKLGLDLNGIGEQQKQSIDQSIISAISSKWNNPTVLFISLNESKCLAHWKFVENEKDHIFNKYYDSLKHFVVGTTIKSNLGHTSAISFQFTPKISPKPHTHNVGKKRNQIRVTCEQMNEWERKLIRMKKAIKKSHFVTMRQCFSFERNTFVRKYYDISTDRTVGHVYHNRKVGPSVCF